MQEIINIVAPVLATLIVALVATVLRSADKWLKTNVSTREYGILAATAATAVLAVEKQFVGEEGEIKKSLAHQFADSLLSSKGIKMDYEAVDAAIEAAVFQHFGK
jgi:LL-H family phage holin